MDRIYSRVTLFVGFLIFFSGCRQESGSFAENNPHSTGTPERLLSLTGVSPRKFFMAGGQLTLSGHGFYDQMRVTLENTELKIRTNCTQLKILSESQATCQAGPYPLDAWVSVSVWHANNSSNYPEGWSDLIQAKPTQFDSFEPAQIPFGVQTRVRVRGNYFQEGMSIEVNGHPCSDLVVHSPQELECTAPAIELTRDFLYLAGATSSIVGYQNPGDSVHFINNTPGHWTSLLEFFVRPQAREAELLRQRLERERAQAQHRQQQREQARQEADRQEQERLRQQAHRARRAAPARLERPALGTPGPQWLDFYPQEEADPEIRRPRIRVSAYDPPPYDERVRRQPLYGVMSLYGTNLDMVEQISFGDDVDADVVITIQSKRDTHIDFAWDTLHVLGDVPIILKTRNRDYQIDGWLTITEPVEFTPSETEAEECQWNFQGVKWGLHQFTANELQEFRASVAERTLVRQESLRALGQRDVWDAQEGVMNQSVRRRYLNSLNLLEARYPHVVPQTQAILTVLRQVMSGSPFLRTFRRLNIPIPREDWGAGMEARTYVTRACCLHRYDRVYQYGTDPDAFIRDESAGLSELQLIALTWFAAQDPAVFPLEQDRLDNQWSLFEGFRRIQTAHPLVRQGNVWLGGPSCPTGTFLRLLESIDQVHPDVNMTPTQPTAEMIAREVRNTHRVLFALKTPLERDEIIAGAATQSRAYQNYLDSLRREVREIAPNLNPAEITNHTNRWMMEALFDE